MGGRREGVRESNGRGWMLQSKVYSQRAYIEKQTPLNINLDINNKRQDYKIGTVWGILMEGREGEQRRLRWENMVDGLHTLIWNRTKKPLVIVLSGAERGLRGRDGGDDLTNVQYKSIWNCHNESPLYNKYILIKN
jgi:hypothetical protein